jgi:hypothetical protein
MHLAPLFRPSQQPQHSPIVKRKSKNHEPFKPKPAKITNPWFGSDSATGSYRGVLRAAVLQRPLIALKMSTASIPLPAQRHHQSAAAAQPPPHSNQHNTHASRYTIVAPQTNNHKPIKPPANIANP